MSDARTELIDPASVGDERQLLVGFLDYYRTVFLRKVEDLDDERSRVKVPPSSMDLLGMTRHLADVERDTGIYTTTPISTGTTPPTTRSPTLLFTGTPRSPEPARSSLLRRHSIR